MELVDFWSDVYFGGVFAVVVVRLIPLGACARRVSCVPQMYLENSLTAPGVCAPWAWFDSRLQHSAQYSFMFAEGVFDAHYSH